MILIRLSVVFGILIVVFGRFWLRCGIFVVGIVSTLLFGKTENLASWLDECDNEERLPFGGQAIGVELFNNVSKFRTKATDERSFEHVGSNFDIIGKELSVHLKCTGGEGVNCFIFVAKMS